MLDRCTGAFALKLAGRHPQLFDQTREMPRTHAGFGGSFRGREEQFAFCGGRQIASRLSVPKKNAAHCAVSQERRSSKTWVWSTQANQARATIFGGASENLHRSGYNRRHIVFKHFVFLLDAFHLIKGQSEVSRNLPERLFSSQNQAHRLAFFPFGGWLMVEAGH